MAKEDDEQFVRVELPKALRAIYARAIIKPTLARKLVFDHFKYGARDVDKGSSEADTLKALAFCLSWSTRMPTTIRRQPGRSWSTLRACGRRHGRVVVRQRDNRDARGNCDIR